MGINLINCGKVCLEEMELLLCEYLASAGGRHVVDRGFRTISQVSKITHFCGPEFSLSFVGSFFEHKNAT